MVHLPFSVPFFDGRVSTVVLSPDGLVNMGSGGFSCTQCHTENAFHAIGLYQTDLALSASDSAVVVYNVSSVLAHGGQSFQIAYQKAPLSGSKPSDPDLTASLTLHNSGRIVMRYESLPKQPTAPPRVFARSRPGLLTQPDTATALGVHIDGVRADSTVLLCPIPKVICISPTCGKTSGGASVIISGYFFDLSCLHAGRPSGGTAGIIRCHFGDIVVPATPVDGTATDGTNVTKLRCISPSVAKAGTVRLQLSYGVGTAVNFSNTRFLRSNGLMKVTSNGNTNDSTGLDMPLENTFTFVSSSSDVSCGCHANSSYLLQCDSCGVCGGTNSCIGCDGYHLSNKVLDACGECGGDNSSCAGCDGIANSGTVRDACRVCNGTNASKDCSGECFGKAAIDDCRRCSGGGTGLEYNGEMDCATVCQGSSRLDNCSRCDNNTQNDCTADCAGVWGGSAAFDACSVCSGGRTGMLPNGTRDCQGNCAAMNLQGEYVLAATLDNCSICSGGTTNHTANSDKDDCGVCFGGNQSKACDGVCFGAARVDFCSVCNGRNETLGCDGACDGRNLPDRCGRCPKANDYGFQVIDPSDSCKPDCRGQWGLKEQRHVIDECGSCGAAADACIADCQNIWGGTAVVDACGICSGGRTGILVNALKDCSGECRGTFLAPRN